MERITHHQCSHKLFRRNGHIRESTIINYGYPNFEWSPGNLIIDGYKREDDDKPEYEHSDGVQEEIPLEDEVYIHEPLEDEYVMQ